MSRSRNLRLARYIYTKSQNNRSSAFCNCNQANPDRCVCGENDSHNLNWTWNTEYFSDVTNLLIDGQNVIFHPIFSQGTAAVKGNKSLDQQMIHYWEIKITSNMTGTDLMIGIGTDKVDLLSKYQYKYSSLLGLDNQSWGYSYRGLAQHNGRLKYYGKRYSSLCIVGVYLDLRRRFIEFYLNRRGQGIAYRQIEIDENADVYPMVSSTAAKSGVRLINATSFVENLQYLCVKVVSKNRESVEFIRSTPGLRHFCNDYWFMMNNEQFRYSEFDSPRTLLEDDAVLCCKSKREYYNRTAEIDSPDESISDESVTDEMDIYNGVDYFKHNISTFSSDDDDMDVDFFCDHI